MMTICAIVLAATLPVFDFATNSIAQRIAGADPAVCLSRFVDYPNCFRIPAPGTKHQAPSTNFWLKDVDFSCVSPWSDSCGAQRAGTLISKRHIVFAKHFPLWKGVRILFVDRNGEVCPCSVEATKPLDKCDIMIGLLDYEVTPNIQPAKILPLDYEKFIGDGYGLPVVTFNQREEAFLTSLLTISTNEHSRMQGSYVPADGVVAKFRKPIIGGDSGNPVFLLIGNNPILLYCLRGGGCGSGPAIHRYRSEIQKAMDDLCPGYKLEAFDFTKVRRENGK